MNLNEECLLQFLSRTIPAAGAPEPPVIAESEALAAQSSIRPRRAGFVSLPQTVVRAKRPGKA